MCGIAGIVGETPSPSVLGAMAAEMAHRGPDGEGLWSADAVGLAFRRLAIIDLDERSNQPQHLDSLHLVFNGEIYNYLELREELRGMGHAFSTDGDAEVLLHAWRAWGEGALERLNGMFAFAVWDEDGQTLTVAADPFGEKPLYWAQRGDRLLFASDVRSILQAEPGLGAPAESTLGPFVALGLMPAIDASFFAGIARLPGGHVLRWHAGRPTVRRYWWPREVEVPSSYGQAVERLRELLLDSIRLRLRSDVPVGTSLSGGVDSSAVVALSGELAGDHRRHAFTASFPGFSRDEWDLARQAANRAGVLEHHEVRPTAPELLRDLDQVVADQEEPFGSTSIYAQWRVMKAAREAGVTVLLDGQGADELFGGYPDGGGQALLSMGPARAAASLLKGHGTAAGLLRAIGAESAPVAAVRRYRRRQASPYASSEAVNQAAGVRAVRPPGSSPLRRELLREAFHTSLPGLLRYADRDSMAHSREVRLPFLDRRVAEFALSLPPDFLYRDGVTKSVLRDAVRGLVPDTVLDRPGKVGFETPERAWFETSEYVQRVRDVLLDGPARRRGFYDLAAIEADARAGQWRDPTALWRAMNVELWLGSVATANPA